MKTFLRLGATFALVGSSVAAALAQSAEPGPWLYQLQNPAPSAIAAAGFPLAVIDYSSDGTEDGEFSPAQIATIRGAGVKVLAYFSIGEAEDYRFYFDPQWKKPATRPTWFGRENPDWRGNFKVRYWETGWRDDVLVPYLDRLIAQGFDGVYLDIVDGFEYWGNPATYRRRETRRAGDPVNEADAAARMIALVAWIADYGATRRGGAFAVYPQNGERLLSYDTADTYLDAVSGFGVEDLWFNGTRRQPAGETAYRLPWLRQARDAGKTILTVEYLDESGRTTGANGRRISDYLGLADAEGFFFYAARSDRELDRINRLPGVQP
jgi:cysteinyl-tRNA synthetase